jgi:hypothetical protein
MGCNSSSPAAPLAAAAVPTSKAITDAPSSKKAGATPGAGAAVVVDAGVVVGECGEFGDL